MRTYLITDHRLCAPRASGSKLPLRALIEKVYRGLFLADGEGLDVMEAKLPEKGSEVFADGESMPVVARAALGTP